VECQNPNEPQAPSNRAKLKDLTFDEHNANKGTERGTAMLADSLQELGAGRSILIDRNNRIIAGNKTAEQAGQVGTSYPLNVSHGF